MREAAQRLRAFMEQRAEFTMGVYQTAIFYFHRTITYIHIIYLYEIYDTIVFEYRQYNMYCN